MQVHHESFSYLDRNTSVSKCCPTDFLPVAVGWMYVLNRGLDASQKSSKDFAFAADRQRLKSLAQCELHRADFAV